MFRCILEGAAVVLFLAGNGPNSIPHDQLGAQRIKGSPHRVLQ